VWYVLLSDWPLFVQTQKNPLVVMETCHVMWVPVTTVWRVLGLQREGTATRYAVPANILNKQLRTANKGWSSGLGLGEGLANPHRKRRRASD
jgi:hypothetical protein